MNEDVVLQDFVYADNVLSGPKSGLNCTEAIFELAANLATYSVITG